ncbi:hypothetical protein KC19_1G207800 [Ceratodon purpureus]|uniref:Uncharacterized protein n=2 Tax=Ceratodon purpureus TaxID=3225 RepID=A0A8T0JA91_CERPU|nr:hypothetical protein KC19_1G207800 [Ceratodon purpureus]
MKGKTDGDAKADLGVSKDYLSPAKEAHSDATDEEPSPIEEVQMTVSTTDDPSLPCMTFRTLVMGITANIVITIINTFFGYRTEPLHVSAIAIQIAALPLGRLMAAVLPREPIGFPLIPWRFSLNPGPFNVKEHVLVTIFANTGSGAMGTMLINVVKAFYKRQLDFVPSLLFVLATQIMGYGSAGLYRKLLVEPAQMWWPHTLVNVSLFRALHEKEEKRTLSRVQFFCICLIVSFAYYIFPGYFFTSLTTISIACILWPSSVTAQQIGSGLKGLGIGSFSLDWATISAFRGSPLGVPFFALANAAVGFILYLYVIIPITYWGINLYDATKFPIFSSSSFADNGTRFDIHRVLTSDLTINLRAYEDYSKLHLSILYAMTNAMGFAVIGAALTHVILFHGKDILRQTRSAIRERTAQDIHTRLMQRYKPVPQLWFWILLMVSLALSVVGAEVYKEQLQLPWWGVLMGFAIATVFALPFGVLVATANQAPGISVLSEMIMGYILPGKPVANICFRVYGSSNLMHTIFFLSDFKLGHYMKIPPRTMFVVQVWGSILSAMVSLGTTWFLLDSIPNICNPALLPPGSPWTCPNDSVHFTASVIWGLIGPARTFGAQGIYNNLNWFFMVGIFAPIPVYIATKMFPKTTWLKWVNMPIILIGGLTMPPASPVNNIMWLSVGMFFNGFIFRRRKTWWKRYNYLLSAALDAGTAFMGILLWMVFGQGLGALEWWGNQGDHCPLAHCPTAAGISVKGCPVF